MLKAQDFANQHQIQLVAIRQTLKKALHLLYYTSNYVEGLCGHYMDFESEGFETPLLMVYRDAMIVGIDWSPNDKFRVVLQNEDGTISFWKLDESDLQLWDYIALLENVQVLLDKFEIDYENA